MPIGLPIVSKFDDKGVKQAGKAIGDFGSGLKKIAGLLAAAFAIDKIKDFAVEAVRAAEEVATSNARLEQIASQMGLFGEQTEAATQRMIDFAEANEISLATDANIIKQTQAKLLTFKELAKSADETGGAFDRATLAAIDLAAAGFGEATSNATQLGKALQDPVKGISALTRVGVTFTDKQKDLIKQMVASNDVIGAQELILAAIEEQVGGTAEATANASEQMELAFGNVNEAIGEALLPVFEDLVEVMLPLIEDITPELQKFFEDMSPLLEDAVTWFGQMAEDALPMVSDGFERASQAIEDIQEFLDPLVGEGGSFSQLGDVFASMEEPMGEVVGFLTTLGETVLSQIKEILENEDFQNGISQMAANFGAVATELDRLLQQEITQWLIDLTAPAVVGGVDFLNWQLERFSIALEAINYALDSLAGKAKSMSLLEKLVKMARFFGVPIPDMFNIEFTDKEENFRVPALASGGIIKAKPGGTLALIGEGGQDEAVIPLGRGAGMMASNYNITINAGVGSDPVAIGRYVTDAIKRYENVSGKVFARA